MKTFSNTDIESLYNRHIKKDRAYFAPIKKKDILTLNFEYSIGGKTHKFNPENRDFPRIKCILDFRDWVEKYKINNISHCLLTDYVDPEIKYLTLKEHTLIYYNFQTGENDLHTIDLAKDKFDFILFNQTIEHLYNPFMAMQQLYDAAAPGGYIFTSVPTINIPHLEPFHFAGYTPMGLCVLFESVGFKTLEVGYWGNYKYIKTIFKTHNWPDYRALLNIFGRIKNTPKNVAQTWILAQKPLTA